MDIEGRVVAIGNQFTGQKKDGTPFRKQEYVLETFGQYPDKVAFYLMGDNIDKAQLQVGSVVGISVNIRSREHQGRWYTEVVAWKVNNKGIAQQGQYLQTAMQPGQDIYQQVPPPGYVSTANPQPAPQPGTENPQPNPNYAF